METLTKVFVLTPEGEAWISDNVPRGHENEAIERLLKHPLFSKDRGSVRFQLNCQLGNVSDFLVPIEGEDFKEVLFSYDSQWRFG